MTITINGILAFCGGISIIGGAVAVLYKWVSPAIKLKSKVDELSEANAELTKKLELLTENTQALCKCVLVLLDSNISGNNIENLKAVKDELQEFLITK